MLIHDFHENDITTNQQLIATAASYCEKAFIQIILFVTEEKERKDNFVQPKYFHLSVNDFDKFCGFISVGGKSWILE